MEGRKGEGRALPKEREKRKTSSIFSWDPTMPSSGKVVFRANIHLPLFLRTSRDGKK